jgi:hypothetical protein
MRLLSSAICTTIAVGLLAGCSGNMGSSPSASAPTVSGAQTRISNGHIVPQWSKLASIIPQGIPRVGNVRLGGMQPDRHHKKKKTVGLYGSQFVLGTINGYKGTPTGNTPPTCSLGASYPNSIAVDGKGNLIDPDGGSRTVIVYNNKLCGAMLGSFSDPYGQPSDAASNNAATGTIAIGNIFDTSGAGSVSICTMSGGCTANLTNSNMYEVAGVAMAKNGDCWADAINSGGAATLTYFAGCTGAGQAATGFTNTYYGGVDIDNKGNLVTIDFLTPALHVYKGCNPACTSVATYSMNAYPIFGHLNVKSNLLAVGNFNVSGVDVYSYSQSALTYKFTITDGFGSGYDTEGAAWNPRSPE